jgi:hydrogenase maturation protease
MTGRTLIACLGNIFLGDDGFGVEVAQRLTGQELPAGVRVTDYGIRGMHLAYDLAEGFDTTILVDAMQRGDEPGTVYVVEPDPARRPAGDAALSLFNAHGMQPDVVLDMAQALGIEAGRVLVVGCEPASLEEGMGLSPAVAAAVDEAVRVVIRLVTPQRPDERRPDERRPDEHGPDERRPDQELSAAGRGKKSRQGDTGNRPESAKR